eukprot:gnl/TRDRNA2_/TRDRNA2_145949_c1_seq1.p1 gnl/TRDRNA2_/TRDRNA2_145949_c1~~gnl/TRDRNA2_/TRDRNA2_145949_c1_seq1.p1  ORF type:complete len:340 (-),score=34.41 gnl/TRDRNA2_/TRDRNA2_145949_c1_seq1:40-1059(-)
MSLVDRRQLVKAACGVWAALIGVSVPFGMVDTIFLNSEVPADERPFHAFYVNTLCIIVGALELIPLAIKADHPASRPKSWWHLAGGICAIPSFFTIPAARQLGTEAVLIVQLAAQLATFFVLDLLDGRLTMAEYVKIVALIIIFGGAVLEHVDGIFIDVTVYSLVSFLIVAISGCGFALQSKCNTALALDVGNSARATIVSAGIYVVFSLPIQIYILCGRHVYPRLNFAYWDYWLFAGFQSAFYIGSYAFLPKILGFTTCYVITLVAKLFTGLVIDASGLEGEIIAISFTRVIAMVIVLAGAIVYNVKCGTSLRGDTYRETCESETSSVVPEEPDHSGE